MARLLMVSSRSDGSLACGRALGSSARKETVAMILIFMIAMRVVAPTMIAIMMIIINDNENAEKIKTIMNTTITAKA